MTLCDDGHQEVCFEGRTCPACALVQEKLNLEQEIQDLKNQLENTLEEE